jgi:hypothetical protein
MRTRIRIERACPGGPWLLRHEGKDGAPWPYVQLADALEDAQRFLAAHDGGELTVEDDRLTTIHVEGRRGPR